MTYTESLERTRLLVGARQELITSLITVFARSRFTALVSPDDWEGLAEEIAAELERPRRRETLRILSGEAPS